MNENTLTSARVHTRLKFEPLRTSCQLRCLTPDSPPMQNLDATVTGLPQYSPDRRLSPCAVLPDIRVLDPDGIFPRGAGNAYLSLDTLEWLVDGTPIGEAWREGTDYAVETSAGDTRGLLRIYRNLAADEAVALRFRGSFLDFRTGTAYRVESDDLLLGTTVQKANQYTCSLDCSMFEYDPTRDALWLWDHLAARGLAVGSREAARSRSCFELTVTALLTCGQQPLAALPEGVEMHVCRLGSTQPLDPASDEAPELMAAAYPTLTLDLRQVEQAAYEVRFVSAGVLLASETLGVHRSATMPSRCMMLRRGDVAAGQTAYTNHVLLQLDDRTLDHPEAYYLITWHTQACYKDDGLWRYRDVRTWQRGASMQAAVEDLDIGRTQNDSSFDLWYDVEPHGPLAPALADDADDAVWCDADGDFFII